MTSSVTGMLETLERKAETQRQTVLDGLEQLQRCGLTERPIESLVAERDYWALVNRCNTLRRTA